MGKKGSWFSAIKRVFVSHSKDKPVTESEERKDKKKNKGNAKLRHGERKSFIPLFREPSSIEKILGEAEREHNIFYRPPEISTPIEQPKTPAFVPPPPPAPPRDPSPRAASPRAASLRAASPRAASPREPSPRYAETSSRFTEPSQRVFEPSPRVVESIPRAASPRAASPRAPSQRIVNQFNYRPEPTLRNHHASATKIQAAYRGYMARRSFRALRGLVRLQGVVRGQNVKRQTMNAMKYMQLLVRVQSQIQSRRIHMLENQARHQAQNKEVESNLGKWSLASEAGNNDDWDDSLLTKEEVEARLQRKVDAVIKRERAMAYAYSNQLWKSNPKPGQNQMMHTGGYPWWWNWLERQLPQTNTPEPQMQTPKSYRHTPQRTNSELKPSPRPTLSSSNKQPSFGFDNIESAGTPMSTRSLLPVSSSKLPRTPPSAKIVPPSVGPSGTNKFSRARAGGTESPFGMKDDDSLVSCPPFSVPNYMVPTVSAKAKARANSNPRDRFPGTPTSESSRRSSFPLTQGSFKWNKGSFFSGSRESPSSRRGNGLDKQQAMDSTGNVSVDSTVSLPVGAIGRKPFNRFV